MERSKELKKKQKKSFKMPFLVVIYMHDFSLFLFFVLFFFLFSFYLEALSSGSLVLPASFIS